MYYKVVDSDDWLDEAALKAVLDKLRAFAGAEQAAGPLYRQLRL